MAWFKKAASERPLTAADAIPLVARGDLTLVDVRELAEVQESGMAKGAVHVPLTSLPGRADPRHPGHDPVLDPSRPIAVYCLSGARSERAAQMLRRIGYAQVHNLGGLKDWQAAGGKLSA
jgi:rhodanese-related sulfurtransferase